MKNSLKLLLLFIGMSLCNSAKAQEQNAPPHIFTYVEQMATFNGNMYAWLKQQVQHPRAADKTRLTGRVETRFVVNENGSLSNFEIKTSSGNKLLDDEALRVIKTMPAFKPGKQNSTLVKVYYTVPITFLDEKTEKDIQRHVLDSAAQMPRFGYNVDGWVRQHIRRPEAGDKPYPDGQTIVKCIINDDGSLSDFTVLKSSGNKLLDKEAIRVAKEMPPWQPGKQNGVEARVYYKLPVTFKHTK